ncbi:hypothetical protein GbCGDNIH7_7151 [Granulibacter bethesdensis]|nr:hypothetical protein GbCGDNIH7_7151 [Granulibacter bethesdensis]
MFCWPFPGIRSFLKLPAVSAAGHFLPVRFECAVVTAEQPVPAKANL